ncbi:MAG: BatD family protein [Spirochaetota bacterium]
MKRTGNILLAFLLAFAVCTTLYSSDSSLSISASVNVNKVGLNDTLELTVVVDAENITFVPGPQLPELESFKVVNETTSSSSRLSLINGRNRRTRTITHTYELQPEQKGSFTIAPVTLTYRGKSYRTSPIIVEVVEGSLKSPDTYMHDQGISVDAAKLKEDIFILTEPEQTSVYQGEQVLFTYTLYSRVDIDSISLKQSPDFQGFYTESIYNASRLEHRKITYQGKVYNTSVLKKVAAFPIKTGTLWPRPMVMEASVVVSEDPHRLFGKPVTLEIRSKNIEVNVRPLPAYNNKVPFSYIVGKLDAKLSKRENTINTGQPLTCYLSLESTGNINTLADPGIELSARGRVYLSDTITRRVEEETGVYFIKKFEYTIIPEEKGSLTVSTEELVHFDPETKTYQTARASPINIIVTGKNILPETPVRDQEPSYTRKLHFIKKDTKYIKDYHTSPFDGSIFYIYHLALLAGAGGLVLVRLRKQNLQKNDLLYRKKKAFGKSTSMLEQAQIYIAQGSLTKAADQINRGLQLYVAYKTGVDPNQVTPKNLDKMLEQLQAGENTRSLFREIINQLTILKFTAGRPEAKNIQQLAEMALQAVSGLEEQVKSGSIRPWNRKRG